jgi:hypothetical protein
MVNQIESGRFTKETPKDWDADLDHRLDRAGQLDDVPLRLTEERIRAETERIGNVEPVETAPKATSAVAVPELPIPPLTSKSAPASRPKPASGPATLAGEFTLTTANQPGRYGSILGSDSTQLRKPESPAAAASPNRVERRSGVRAEVKALKNPRPSRVLSGVVAALVIALAAESGYAYLAIRRNSVNVSQLPGAAVLRTLSAEMKGARWKLEQSSVSADLNAAGHQAGATLNAAYQGARRLAGEVRDRYNQRHGR